MSCDLPPEILIYLSSPETEVLLRRCFCQRQGADNQLKLAEAYSAVLGVNMLLIN